MWGGGVGVGVGEGVEMLSQKMWQIRMLVDEVFSSPYSGSWCIMVKYCSESKEGILYMKKAYKIGDWEKKTPNLNEDQKTEPEYWQIVGRTVTLSKKIGTMCECVSSSSISEWDGNNLSVKTDKIQSPF